MNIHNGNCLDVMKTMPDNSVDSIVTDPPYGLSFMGEKWDYDVPSEEIWRECLRVLKPGGHLLAFAGTRTQHRMAVRIEGAGFEIRDMIAWVYGQGFPKSLNLDGEWNGWGTALKPALEPISVARKPLSEKTVAANVLKWGTGAINIDGGRVRFENGDTTACAARAGAGSGKKSGVFGQAVSVVSPPHEKGRFPANLIHDGSDEVLELFPETKSEARSGKNRVNSLENSNSIGTGWAYTGGACASSSGSAARFFYCAKASKKDRGADNKHPTVKPTDLMRYLVRLVTPPGGVVLDPFMGSGSTGKAARLEGFHFIGIEREAEYVEIAKARIGGAA